MEISTFTVSRVFQTYQGQARIAELNSKNPFKRVQEQQDRVSISKEARAVITKHTMEQLLKKIQLSQTAQGEKAPSESLETQTVQAEKIEAKKNIETTPPTITE